MKKWAIRPKEEANLLNPAFCCIIVSASIREYSALQNAGMPFPVSYLILPIVLHKPTRDALPGSVRTSMAAWMHDNAALRIQFPERLRSLRPFTSEAIRWGINYQWLEAKAGGRLSPRISESAMTRALRILQDEARECVLRARLVGKWFANAGSSSTVMAFWGIRP